MKNSILFTLAFITSVALTAQDVQWRIGLKLNPNVSWMKPDSKYIKNEGNNLRLGFTLMIDKYFTENYAIGTGLNIFTTGGELTYARLTNENLNGTSTPFVSNITRDYTTQYVEVPLTLKLRTNEIGYITYWGQFGVGLGVNIRAKADQSVDYTKQFVSGGGSTSWETASLESYSVEDEDVKDDISIFRPSLIVGAGIEYSLSGSTAIIAGVTYNNGFSDCLRGKGVVTDDRDEPVFELKDGKYVAKEYDLKGMSNFIALNVGIVF